MADGYAEIIVGCDDDDEGIEIIEWNGSNDWATVLTYELE